MWLVDIATRDFVWEFEQHARDMGMAEEDAKVYLVMALDLDTLSCLDTYVTMYNGGEMVHLETIQYRLCYIPYIQILEYLKYGELSKLAILGARGVIFAVDRS